RDLRDRDVPPPEPGYLRVRIDGDVDQRAVLLARGRRERGAELLLGARLKGREAEARRVRHEVDGERRPSEPPVRLAMPELVAEALPAAGPLEAVDALIAVVVEEDDGDRDPLLPRGEELAREHQVAAVADERVDLARRVRELHAERAGDL